MVVCTDDVEMRMRIRSTVGGSYENLPDRCMSILDRVNVCGGGTRGQDREQNRGETKQRSIWVSQ
jgi:hypothetical protein